MATIKDVAQLSGVSVSTVSNVINGNNRVSDDKYTRVIKAIETLNYTPNMFAKNLKQKKSMTLAIVVCELDTVTAQCIDGICKTVDIYGYSCIVKVTNHNAYQERTYLNELQFSGVAGIFIQTCDCLQDFSNMGTDIPIVMFDNYVEQPDIPAVIFNNREIIECALQQRPNDSHAFSEDEIAVITASSRYNNDMDCLRGVQNTYGDSVNAYQVSISTEQAYADLLQIFKNKQLPKLFVVSRISIARGIRKMLDCYDSSSTVMSLSDARYDQDIKNITLLRRKTIQLGITVAEMMMKYIKAPMFYEKKLIVVSSKQIYSENHDKFKTSCKKLRIAMYDGPTAQSIVLALPSFERVMDISIDYELFSYDELYKLIQNTGTEKNGEYDLFMLDLYWFESLRNERYLLNLSDYLQKDNDGFLNNFNDQIHTLYLHANHGIYTFPILVNMQYLFYRKDLFNNPDIKNAFYKKYGLELTLPKTWRDFEIIAQFFTKSFNPSSPVLYGTTLQGLDRINIVEEFFPRQWSFGGKIVSSSNQVVIDKNENVRALTNLKRSYACTPQSKISHNWRDEADRMLNNEIAMHFTFSTHVNMAFAGNTGVDANDVGISLAPSDMSMLGGWNLAVNRYSEYPFEAYRFIKWLVGEKMALSNTLTGSCVPHNSVINNDCLLRMHPWIGRMSLDISRARKREILLNHKGQPIDNMSVDRIIADSINPVLYSDADIPQMLSKMKENLQELINNDIDER